MTNEIKTHRIVVTLPDCHPIEANILAPQLENFLRTARENGLAVRTNGAVLGRASTALPYDKVTAEVDPPVSFGIPAITRNLKARRLQPGQAQGNATAGWLQIDVNDDLQCNFPGIPEASAAFPDAFFDIEDEPKWGPPEDVFVTIEARYGGDAIIVNTRYHGDAYTADEARQLARQLDHHASTLERNQADAKYAAHVNKEV